METPEERKKRIAHEQALKDMAKEFDQEEWDDLTELDIDELGDF